MFYLDSNSNKYYIGRAFSYGDIQYSHSAATHAKFTELGFTQVIIGARPDNQFYIVSGPDLTGAYTSTARDLNQLKLNFILREKLASRQTLSASDWLVTRNQELGTAIPANYVTYRAAVRSASDSRCNEIAAATDVADLEALIKAPAEIEDTNNPGTFITNPDAMTQYPDVIDEESEVATDYGL